MTVHPTPGAPATTPRSGFFRALVTAMAAILISGFVVQLAMGRSSFHAPAIVHVHAVVFMGWVGIMLAQVWLVTAGAVSMHRTLGRLAGVWALAMLVLGPLVTVEAVREGRVPFFFQPQHFLLADPATVFGFVGLFAAAVLMRKHTDWHARLQVGAFVMLLGPGIGRLIPLPLLAPYAFEIAALIPLCVLVFGAAWDARTLGRVHPAWLVSGAALIGLLVAVRLIAFSPLGDALYAFATEGALTAGTDGRAFPPPPGPPPS